MRWLFSVRGSRWLAAIGASLALSLGVQAILAIGINLAVIVIAVSCFVGGMLVTLTIALIYIDDLGRRLEQWQRYGRRLAALLSVTASTPSDLENLLAHLARTPFGAADQPPTTEQDEIADKRAG
jgi:hypothetical protein